MSNRSQNLKNRSLEGVWEVLGATFAGLADLGEFWPGSDRTKSHSNDQRWRQDAPSWDQDGQLEAIWGAILSIFGGLGSDL